MEKKNYKKIIKKSGVCLIVVYAIIVIFVNFMQNEEAYKGFVEAFNTAEMEAINGIMLIYNICFLYCEYVLLKTIINKIVKIRKEKIERRLSGALGCGKSPKELVKYMQTEFYVEDERNNNQ